MKIKSTPCKNYLNKIFKYDEGKLFWSVDRLPAVKSGNRAGKLDTSGYRKVMVDGEFYSEHRIIYKMISDFFDESKLIDHIDCNKSNNKIENLRLADKYQNMHNQMWNKRNEHTGVKGIDCIKDGVFRARVQQANKRVVKHFKELSAAKQWLIETRNKLHLEFSNNG